MKCPKCGSKKTVPIMYGLPLFNEELIQKLNNNELYIGGCCIPYNVPTHHCLECNKNVGSSPILLSKNGEENYRDIVTGIHFYDGGYFGGYKEITIKKNKKTILLTVYMSFEPEDCFQRKMTEEEWTGLLDRLYKKLYLHEWKKSFYDPYVLDGEQWALDIKLTNGRSRHYHGSNEFPPYWSELKTTFRPFFKEAGIKY